MEKQQYNSPILKNEKQNKQFIDLGYSVLKKFIKQKKVEELKHLYKSNFDTKDGMFVTHTSNNFKKNKYIFEKIFHVISPEIESTFINTKPVLAHFAVKNNKGNNAFLLHQDYSITDEEQFEIAHIWIALGKVNPYNGGMMIIPKSHKHYKTYRSGTFGVNFLPFEKMKNRAIGFELDAGDAIIYHPSVFHGSKDNLSDKDRLAVITAVASKEAPLLYYQKTDEGADIYELTEKDLFSRLFNLAQGELPSGNFIKKIKVDRVNQEMIMEKIQQA